jgi:transposase
MVQRELTEEQWLRIGPHLPERKASPKGGPKPKEARDCFEGILWLLRTGARWKDMPDCFPSGSTCWRALRDWEQQGAWEAAWHAFLDELTRRDRAMWEQVFADAMFVPAKKGAIASAKPSVAKARSWLWWAAARAFLWHTPSPRQVRRRPR